MGRGKDKDCHADSEKHRVVFRESRRKSERQPKQPNAEPAVPA